MSYYITMLREIINIRQTAGDDFKQWFTDDIYWDLFIWTNKSGELSGFQLCYDKTINEHALSWFKDRFYKHSRIGTGRHGQNSMSPILVANGLFNKQDIADKFLQDSKILNKKIIEFIYKKIVEYNE